MVVHECDSLFMGEGRDMSEFEVSLGNTKHRALKSREAGRSL